MTRGQAWKTPELANKFLSGVRGAIPLANEQIEVMIRLIKGRFMIYSWLMVFLLI